MSEPDKLQQACDTLQHCEEQLGLACDAMEKGDQLVGAYESTYAAFRMVRSALVELQNLGYTPQEVT